MGKSVACTIVAWSVAAATGGAIRAAPPAVPPDLPKYDLKLKLDTTAHVATFTQTITWTNRTQRPTDELLVNFYPHYRIPEGDYLLLAKTLELLRLNPRYGIDRNGKHGDVQAVRLVPTPDGKPAGHALAFQFLDDNSTAFKVKLPGEVGPGQSVTVQLDATITLPNKQGRWGHWEGVSFLTNSLPVVAYYDAAGWHAMPFVPWHQPFWNEAGVYTATIDVPADQKLALSAAVASEATGADGWKTVVTKPFVGRDFAILASDRYMEFTSETKLPDGRVVKLKCLAFEKHAFYAEEILKIVGDAIPVYSQWFGDYPYDQFTVAESYFGWNGNECAGLIMIDERVFAMPHLGRGYVEYLVSHETCHQWWYNLVGTNGYAETFMDEGAATYFTHRMLDQRHGKNNPIIAWPGRVKVLPDVGRENYRQASYVGSIRRGNAPAAAGDLPTFGHLVGLFTGAYDRGSKVFAMVEGRLGEQAFFDFIRGIVRKYGWGVLTADMLKAELEAYTGQNWDEFFTQWVFGKGLTDWAVESVDTRVDRPRPLAFTRLLPNSGNPNAPRRIAVVVRQKGELDESTVIGFRMPNRPGYDVRVPVGRVTQPMKLDEYDATVEPLGDGRIKVELTLPGEPQQVAIDPDNLLPDGNRGNNTWHTDPRVSITPAYTLLNETDLTNDYDRWNFGLGSWVWGASYPDPWYTRSTMIGVRAGAFRTQEFTGGVYGAFRTDYRDAVVGVDGLIDHWPLQKLQLGYNFEQRVGGPWFDQQGTDTARRGALYSRYVLEYGSSLYLPPIHYVEGYTTYSDNFLPDARTQPSGAVRPDWTWLTGIHYRLNLYTPYWDPECGIWLDASYGAGVAGLGSNATLHQLRGELAAVKKLPDSFGRLGDTRVALRGVAMGAFPDRGMFYALGGSTLFRGFDLAERQGSFLWVGNAEVRLPLIRDVEWDAFDCVGGIRNVWLAPFYDVGAVYSNGRAVDGVAHALGVGLRIDLAIFSFLERATVRFDVAKTINSNSPLQFWFGVQHPF